EGGGRGRRRLAVEDLPLAPLLVAHPPPHPILELRRCPLPETRRRLEDVPVGVHHAVARAELPSFNSRCAHRHAGPIVPARNRRQPTPPTGVRRSGAPGTP